MRNWRRERMRNSQRPFPRGATQGLPRDKPWVRSISMPTIVSTRSSVISRSINSWTGILPLDSRKYSIRQSTNVRYKIYLVISSGRIHAPRIASCDGLSALVSRVQCKLSMRPHVRSIAQIRNCHQNVARTVLSSELASEALPQTPCFLSPITYHASR